MLPAVQLWQPPRRGLSRMLLGIPTPKRLLWCSLDAPRIQLMVSPPNVTRNQARLTAA